MATVRRPYRKHYITSWGETVIGLTKSSDGRFRPIGHSTPAWAGRDEAKAIHRFRQWQDAQNPATLTYDELAAGEGISFPPDAYSKKHWRDYFHNLLLTDPRRAAIELDDERLSRLDELGDRKPSVTLTELGDLYAAKKLSPKWQRKALQFWAEFGKLTGAKQVVDLGADELSRYSDAILRRDKSPTYTAQRFGVVKSILAHGLKRGKDIDRLQRVLTLCKMLEAPKKASVNPQPITPQHFRALVEVAKPKWQALYLLALNAALYPSEVAAVQSSHINLDEKTLVMDRDKTGVPRVAVLWERTIVALREHLSTRKRCSPYLFVATTGNPYDGNHVTRHFRRHRSEAQIPDSVEFAHIRDGAYTAAVEAGVDAMQASLLAGHRTGIKDAYVKRGPKMVTQACEAIERAYFGAEK